MSATAPARNAPCPCGSGKKYKQCCLKKGGPPPGAAAASAPRDDVGGGLEAAQAAQRAGRLDQAESILRAIVERHPKQKAALHGLGEVLGQMGRPGEGIPFVERSIAAGGRRAPTYSVLAELLLSDRRPDDAVAAAKRALRLDDTNLSAMRVLATAHERLEAFDEALAVAQRMRKLHPTRVEGAQIAARVLRRRGKCEEALAVLEPHRDQRLDPLLASWYEHERGLVLDGLGRYEEACAAFNRSGRIQLETPAGRRFDPSAAPAVVARFRAGVTRDRCTRFPADALVDDGPTPAFLVGFPRSGTTMTEQILAAHPDIDTAGETEIIPAVLRELQRIGPATGDETADLAALDLDGIRALRACYRTNAAALAEEERTGRVLVDKLPLNIIYLGLINVIFPEARIVVALRDPRDVCVSCLMQFFELNEGMIHLTSFERAAAFYAQVMDLWLAQRDVLTLDWIEVKYEDTVTDLPGQGRRIVDHLGLAWSDEILAFHEKARTRRIWTPSYAAVRERVHTRAIARWKRYAPFIEPAAFERLAPFVEAFGYDAGPAH